ncbi:MAG: hypothetical protein RLZZ574_2269 [Cyanobacteriota bacterium]
MKIDIVISINFRMLVDDAITDNLLSVGAIRASPLRDRMFFIWNDYIIFDSNTLDLI